MYGMWQYRIDTITIDLDKGECEGEDCDWEGIVDATLDPIDGRASYECGGCGTTGYREIPEEYFLVDRDD